MTLGSTTAARRIAFCGAFLMISASSALGAYFGFTVGAHQHVALGVIFGAAALGGELLKPVAVAGAIDAFRAREFLRGLTCLLLAAVCVIYSLAAELSLAAGSRGDLAATRNEVAEAGRVAAARRTRAEAELQELRPARPVSELEPLIAKLKATPGANGCDRTPDGPVSRRICGEVADLQAEAARASRRAELEAVIAAPIPTFADGVAAVKDADPLASALSAYASALGYRVRPEALAPWLALVPVLFLELGSALALVVARSVGPGQPAPAPAVATASVAAQTRAQVEPEPVAEPETKSCPAPNRRRPRRNDDDQDGPRPGRGKRRLGNVVDLLKARGGQIEGGQRTIARALGVSKSRANEVLHELATLGRIKLRISRVGTVVSLA